MTTTQQITEHPILFTGEMVCAILDGRKTQTRRVIKPQPGDHPNDDGYNSTILGRCPYGAPGDQLWVRETFCLPDPLDKRTICYRASGDPVTTGEKWKPSIHMPRWASRIDLLIKKIRVERVQDITLPDVRAEATTEPQTSGRMLNLCRQFIMYWDELNAKRAYSWESNPWVWVVEFERLKP